MVDTRTDGLYSIYYVMDGIKQIILLGRQEGIFILVSAQQVNASTTLSTELRDNLFLRIALGANSNEGYRMVFGSATPDNLKPIEVKGAGYLYMQGSGRENAQYWESPYCFCSRNGKQQDLSCCT